MDRTGRSCILIILKVKMVISIKNTFENFLIVLKVMSK